MSAQFVALLTDDLWIRAADGANRMARLLERRLRELPGVQLTQTPEVNAVFGTVPADRRTAIQDWSFVWDWDLSTSELRWMTHWGTTTDDVDRYTNGLGQLLA